MTFFVFSPTVAGGSAFIVLAATVISLVKRSFARPKLLAGAPFVGLNGGKSSLQDARLQFLTNGGEMIKEGYDMVSHQIIWKPIVLPI